MNYNDQLATGIVSLTFSIPVAAGYRLAERWYFNPDYSPFLFGLAFTAAADLFLYFDGFSKFTDYIRNNPVIFTSGAIGYMAAVKLVG